MLGTSQEIILVKKDGRIQREKFKKEHDVLDRIQLKNKQDSPKKDFQSFAELVVKDTSLGWNYEKNTIVAYEE